MEEAAGEQQPAAEVWEEREGGRRSGVASYHIGNPKP
jgi:hypothetical protein